MGEETQLKNEKEQDPAIKDVESKKKEEPKSRAKDKVIKIKESEHQKLLDQLEEQKDKYLRLYAEFDNARKRMDREKQDFVKYANEGLIIEFLNILDDLERTVDAAKEKHADNDALRKGVEMVMNHVYELLKRHGVKPIEAKGKSFDPYCHEVLAQEENNEMKEETVLEEFQKGYYLGDRVIRIAKIKIAKKGENKGNTKTEKE